MTDLFPDFTGTLTVELPTLFYYDHRVVRDCGAGDIVEREGKYITKVTLDRDGLIDIYTDADYYQGFDRSNGDYAANRALCDSAARTLTRLDKKLDELGIARPNSVWDAAHKVWDGNLGHYV